MQSDISVQIFSHIAFYLFRIPFEVNTNVAYICSFNLALPAALLWNPACRPCSRYCLRTFSSSSNIFSQYVVIWLVVSGCSSNLIGWHWLEILLALLNGIVESSGRKLAEHWVPFAFDGFSMMQLSSTATCIPIVLGLFPCTYFKIG